MTPAPTPAASLAPGIAQRMTASVACPSNTSISYTMTKGRYDEGAHFFPLTPATQRRSEIPGAPYWEKGVPGPARVSLPFRLRDPLNRDLRNRVTPVACGGYQTLDP